MGHARLPDGQGSYRFSRIALTGGGSEKGEVILSLDLLVEFCVKQSANDLKQFAIWKLIIWIMKASELRHLLRLRFGEILEPRGFKGTKDFYKKIF